MYVFIYFKYIINRNRIAGSYGNHLAIWGYFRLFQSDCTILLSFQQRVRVPISPHPHQHLLLSVFLIIAILEGIKWFVICISLMADDVKHLVKCLLVICHLLILYYVYLLWTSICLNPLSNFNFFNWVVIILHIF